ncbi:ROK family transcriptional regulator [Culicoidibacter larvae]|uniref:ROK family transcriptional regulator n=1 Tax=Culicoidibacter larvae TaxID=2579976 RepID=A0A5R8QA11_9FIRM|nr:ROK family transcriptional regulator [Culicoidibacter larvae]TLG72763.1 ROK family transcriptional regulator [Culicoidibacter larvae]
MEVVDVSVSRKINTRILLETIIENPGISRADLSRATGLNKATVSYIIKELEDEGLIVFRNEKITTGARQALAIDFNKEAGQQIVIELKRDHIGGFLVNLLGEFEYQTALSIEDKEYDVIKDDIIQVIQKIMSYADQQRVIAIGIVVPATVTLDKKINFASYFNWKNVDLRYDIEQHFGIETFLENEANLGAIAENNVYFHDTKDLININIDSGVGLGVVLDGQIQYGYSGFLGEFGHTTLVPNGKLCSCGNRGCFELYTSEHYVLEHYEALRGTKASVSEFIEALREEEAYALAVYTEFIEYFTIGIHNLLVLLNPEIVVINSRIISEYAPSVEYVKAMLVSKEINYCDIVVSKLPDTSSVIGMSNVITKSFLGIEKLSLFR